jgi:hypothetical protein
MLSLSCGLTPSMPCAMGGRRTARRDPKMVIRFGAAMIAQEVATYCRSIGS